MTTLVDNFLDPARMPPVPLHRFTVEEYHRMIASGVLNENDRVELLEGWVVSKMAHNPPHDGMIDLLVGEIQKLLPEGWFARVQSAITTADSEPEPDIAIVKGPRSRYFKAHPQAHEIGLLVEVADTTLHNDRTFKAALYARAGIACYWVVNLPDSQIEVHTEPFAADVEPGYANKQRYGKAESVPLSLDGREVGRIELSPLFLELTK